MFRKIVKIAPSPFQLDHSDRLITLGSCFSDSIGKKLKLSRFELLLNPFGTIFHPNALSSLFKGVDRGNMVSGESVFFHWQFGGAIYGKSREELISKVDDVSVDFCNKIENATVVWVTLGTAWGYILKETNEIVANCHKKPQQLFDKKLFGAEEILEEWQPIIDKFNDVKWVFTVSPVRHWKDGVRENNVSKGILHHAIHKLLENNNVFYFPAYEILLDELRDYRFYDSDYLHPSQEAIDYIWMRFRETYFSSRTEELVKRIEHVEISKNHKIMFPDSEESRKFLRGLETEEREINEVLSEYLI
ncbi:MAG: GSCFA domain-containing protein [Flavobacteriales bacterium]|nr:GSCFA domain-containing protein [Flavobacteriales bacterium]